MAWFSWQQAKQLDPSLNALDGFFSEPPVKVQTVTGGLTNRCWRLESSQALLMSGDRPATYARLFLSLVITSIKFFMRSSR